MFVCEQYDSISCGGMRGVTGGSWLDLVGGPDPDADTGIFESHFKRSGIGRVVRILRYPAPTAVCTGWRRFAVSEC